MAASPQIDFGPYAQILKTLLPRARGIYVYAPDAELLWSADGADLNDLRPSIEQLLEAVRKGSTTTGERHLLEDAPAYCFVLRDELGAGLGALAVVCRAASRDGDLAPLETIERTLGPLLLLARREFAQQRALDTGRFNVADSDELQWLLDVTSADPPASGAGDTLQALLGAFVARAECDVALLHVPSRRLQRVASRCALDAGEIERLQAVVSRHLLRVAQLQQKTLIVNKVRDSGADSLVPFRILCVPLLRRGQALGVVVAFNRAAGRPFAAREVRMLERLAPRLQEVIDVRFDGTTGLLTRHAFDEQAAALLARPAGASRWLVYADLDHLRSVNELYGFEAGDAVLRAVGDVWRGQPLPADSFTARAAGDRFIALLEGCSPEAARAWAEATRLALAALALPDPLASLRFSASFGIALLAPGGTLEHAIAGAEGACKAAKELGRNRVELATPPEARVAGQQQELRMQRELLEAIENGRLELYAQPMKALWDPSRPERYEILVHLQDSSGQSVPAQRFVGIAARTGLLGRVDEWVLGELAQRLAGAASFVESAGAVFAVNLSLESLQRPDLAARVAATLATAGVPTALVGFEVSERDLATSLAGTERVIAALAEIGCRVSVDDFGSGATSLAYLKELRVTELKIDGAFTGDLMRNPRSESMVRAILQIARQLEMTTVAECIETKEAATHLATLGVTYGQGMALGEPRPLAQILKALAQKSAPRLTEAVARALPDEVVH